MADKPASKFIVVLGGSYGGVSTAHYVLKHAMPKPPDTLSYQVVLVSPSTGALLRPACPRALISDNMFPQDKLFASIPKAFEQYSEDSFRFLQGTATHLDHGSRIVTVSLASGETETLTFHAIVIATGASTPSPLLGLNRDEDFLRASWAAFRDALPSAKTIVIAGGGPAGVETAGELGEFLNGRAGWLGTKPTPKVAVTVVCADSKILPALRPSIATKAEQYLANVGVAVMRNARVASVSPLGVGTENVASKATVTLADGNTLEADLYIPATGTRPNTSFLAQSLLAADGRVDTNRATLRVDKAGPLIYAIGDASSFARPAVHNLLAAIPILGANIKRDLLLAAGMDENAVGPERLFKEDARETQMVPIGKGKGVGAAMGFQLPSAVVWMIKGRDYWLWTTGPLWSGKQWTKEA